MSLSVYLYEENNGTGIFVRDGGRTRELGRAEWDEKFPGLEPVVDQAVEELYWANITHNLNQMAREAGVYEALWRPDEIGVMYAQQLIPLLEEGLEVLQRDPERFKQFNPSNGWGAYEGLVEFVREYLGACREYPHAVVEVSR